MENGLEKSLGVIFLSFIMMYTSWFYGLVILYAICIAMDYLSGTACAIKQSNWSSSVARDGIWKKIGSICAILVSALTDLLIQILTMGISIDINQEEYKMLFCPLVLSWYILTELGSVIENAYTLGAPIPEFLSKAIKKINDAIENKSGKED